LTRERVLETGIDESSKTGVGNSCMGGGGDGAGESERLASTIRGMGSAVRNFKQKKGGVYGITN